MREGGRRGSLLSTCTLRSQAFQAGQWVQGVRTSRQLRSQGLVKTQRKIRGPKSTAPSLVPPSSTIFIREKGVFEIVCHAQIQLAHGAGPLALVRRAITMAGMGRTCFHATWRLSMTGEFASTVPRRSWMSPRCSSTSSVLFSGTWE